VTGHIAGAPIEELLPLLGGVGAAVALARARVVARLRAIRQRRPCRAGSDAE
jgi:hypothetical protein